MEDEYSSFRTSSDTTTKSYRMNGAPSSMLQYIVKRVTVNVELHEALNISSLQGWFRSIVCAKRTPRACTPDPPMDG